MNTDAIHHSQLNHAELEALSSAHEIPVQLIRAIVAAFILGALYGFIVLKALGLL